MAIEVERLAAEAAMRHGIRLDPQDPALVLVTLNRLVLEEVAQSMTADMRWATREFEEAANRVQSRFGAAIAARLKAIPSSGALPQPLGLRACSALAFGATACVFLCGVAVGRWLL